MPLWKRQPGESAPDFTAFACYLRLKGRRSLPAVAGHTKLRLGTVRRLSAQYNWRSRVRAFEAALAQATEEALQDSIFNHPAACQAALDNFRLQEFHFAKKVLEAANEWLRRASNPRRRKFSIDQMVRLIDLSFKLQCFACGLPYDTPKPRARHEDRPGYWTAPTETEALARICRSQPASP